MDESDEEDEEETIEEERRDMIESMVDKTVQERRVWLAEHERCNVRAGCVARRVRSGFVIVSFRCLL